RPPAPQAGALNHAALRPDNVKIYKIAGQKSTLILTAAKGSGGSGGGRASIDARLLRKQSQSYRFPEAALRANNKSAIMPDNFIYNNVPIYYD
ncbi:MAG TPA: hypothetical protein PLX02_14100, partial [Syntrophorhabdaceae bacterium]|nr:hypothetical protein [Syntrophorhabdaceae bacterium]